VSKRRHSGKPQRSVQISVRVLPDEAAELHSWARRSGRTVSDIVREGMRYPLERHRALWLEEHRSDPGVWEAVGAPAGTPRRPDAVFGVRLTGEQMRAILPAAESWDMPLSGFLREAGLRLAAAMAEGGSVQCAHMSLGSVTAAACAQCGPLAPVCQVTA
jgi:hypothetical protein